MTFFVRIQELSSYAFLDEKKIILRDRVAEKTEDGPCEPAPTQEEPSVPSMYNEEEAEEPEDLPGEDVPTDTAEQDQVDDKSFKDDIPWTDDDKPGKKGKPGASFRDDFQKHMQERKESKAVETAPAPASEELDIF